jgi:deoxyribonuclease V
VDVHYLSTGGARAAAVLAAHAAFAHVLAERTALVPRAAPCRPGEFYLRELPPPRAVLADLDELGLLVADGYADLDPGGRPGLGARAHAEFGIPVIEVAKSPFRTATHAVPVPHRSPARPLLVTAAGMPAADRQTWSGTCRPVSAARHPCAAPIPSHGPVHHSHHDRPPARLTWPYARQAALCGWSLWPPVASASKIPHTSNHRFQTPTCERNAVRSKLPIAARTSAS